MTREHGLSTWRSIRTTFFLFLIIVPILVVTRLMDARGVENAGDDLILPAGGLLIFAGLVAEIGRRLINFLVGANICQWRART